MDTGRPNRNDEQLFLLQNQVKELLQQIKSLKLEKDKYRDDRDRYAARLAEAEQKSRFASLDATVARDNQSEASQELSQLKAERDWLKKKHDSIYECLNLLKTGYSKEETIDAISDIIQEGFDD